MKYGDKSGLKGDGKTEKGNWNRQIIPKTFKKKKALLKPTALEASCRYLYANIKQFKWVYPTTR